MYLRLNASFQSELSLLSLLHFYLLLAGQQNCAVSDYVVRLMMFDFTAL
jgi:hypothetical protein